MAKLFLKGVRYLKCYGELAFGGKPHTVEGTIDYCVDRPILMTQVCSEAGAKSKINIGIKKSSRTQSGQGSEFYLYPDG
jgi:hypothetical protein